MLKKIFSTAVSLTFSINLFAAGGLCETMTLKQANIASEILGQSDKMVTCDNYDHHEQPCTYGSWHIAGDTGGQVQERGNGVYSIVAFGTDLLDLSSVWVKTGSSNYTNLATLVGCKKIGNTPNLKLIRGEKLVPASFNLKNKLTCLSSNGKKKVVLTFQPDGLNYLQNEMMPTLAAVSISGKVSLGSVNIMGDGKIVPFPTIGEETFIGGNSLLPYQDETGVSAVRGFLIKMKPGQEEPEEATTMTCR